MEICCPPIFHPLAGRESCLTCHGADKRNVAPKPGVLCGEVVSSCRTCHRPASNTIGLAYGLLVPFGLIFGTGVWLFLVDLGFLEKTGKKNHGAGPRN